MNREALAKFYTQYSLYIFPGAIVASSLILIIFIIFPQTSKLISNVQLEKELKNRHVLLEAKANTLADLDQQDLTEKVDFVLSAYPAEKDFASVVGLLQKLTSQSGFNILTLTLGQASAGKYGDSQSYSVKLEILGPKNFFADLLDSIENSPRIVRVNSLDITSTRDTEVVNVNLGLEVLFETLPLTFGTLDSPLPQLSSEDEQLLTELSRTPITGSPQAVTLTPKGKANPFE